MKPLKGNPVLTVALLFLCLFTLGLGFPADEAEGDEVKIGGKLNIPEGKSVEDALVIFGEAKILGKVEGDLVVVLGNVILGEKSVIEGDCVLIGGMMERHPQAKIKGEKVFVFANEEVTSKPTSKRFRRTFPLESILALPFWGALGLFFSLFILLAFLGLAILIYLVIPKQMETIAGSIDEDFLKTLLYGFLGSLLLFPSMGFLLISIIGIPLIPVVFVLVSVAYLIGFIALGQAVGRKIVERLNWAPQSLIIEMLLGITVLRLVGLLPIIGGLVLLIAYLAGFGGVLASRFGTEPHWLEGRFSRKEVAKEEEVKTPEATKEDNRTTDEHRD